MALSTILRRSASRFISGGNRIYGNLILPSASVPAFRQFSSSSPKDENESHDAKRPSLNDLISQVQALQREIELLRNPSSRPLSAVKVEESLAQGQGVEESESVHKGIDDDSFLKGMAIESSNDQVEDCESDKNDDDSNDEGKGSDSNDSSSDDSSDDDSKDQGKGSDSDDSSSDDSSDDDSKDQGKGSDSDDSSSDDDSSDEKSSTDGDNSNDESLSEADDKNESSDHESGDTLPKPDDESLPKSKENEELLKGIEAEILRAKTFMELSAPAAVIPADFPFKISDHYYSGKIHMTQEYKGELVKVYVESPTIFMNNRQCNDYKEKKSSSFSMDLTVLVSDLSSKTTKVELKCSARPGGISVNSASDPADHEIHMSDVNENLREEFGKYLEARGITLSTTEFMYGYMLDKANKERLRILENIQKMVSA